MQRPTVVHVARDWVRPSESFVSDVVRSTTATRAVVACGSRDPGSPAANVPVRSYALDGLVGRLPWRYRRTARNALLAGVTATERAAVLHAHFGYWAGHVDAVARRLRRPWLVSLHGHDLLVEARHDPDAMAALRRAAAVVVPSRFFGEQAVAAGLDPDTIRVIPSGVDLSSLPFRERTPSRDGGVTVTFAGRFVEKKGLLPAADAIGRVAAARPGIRARFVGFGPLEDDLRRRIADLGLDAEVVDGTRDGAVRAALGRTDLLITPSRTAGDGNAETLGLVNVEAQACGVPVVTTRHGGIPEAVSPDAGVLVDEGDDAGLADALADLAAHPERWPGMGHAGRRHVARRFELGSRVADLEEQYVALAAGRPAPPVRPPGLPDRPAVSVVMVTHQRRRLVERTLDALAAQTYPDLEVVVVDNGTDDGTREHLAERTAPERLVVLRNETNRPPVEGRNRAVSATSGAVIAFTDDDCRPTPTWVEALLAGFRDGIGLVQGRTTPDPDQVVRPLSRTQWTPAEYGLYETANIAYRRDVFEEVGGFDGAFAGVVADTLPRWLSHFPFGEDTDLAWRAKRAGAGSRFAVTAHVHHHVFPPDIRLLLRRAVVTTGFPAVVRQVPELREHTLVGRVFLGPHRPRLWAALLGAAGALVVDERLALLALPYAWSLLKPLRPRRAARLRACPVLVAGDLVETGALLLGSARARSLVL